MIDVILYHVVADKSQPLFVVAAVKESAPLAYEERIHILLNKVSPCVSPVIIKESLLCEVLVEPALIAYFRTVVMRRVDYL